jgi:hypothetical protein
VRAEKGLESHDRRGVGVVTGKVPRQRILEQPLIGWQRALFGTDTRDRGCSV